MQPGTAFTLATRAQDNNGAEATGVQSGVIFTSADTNEQPARLQVQQFGARRSAYRFRFSPTDMFTSTNVQTYRLSSAQSHSSDLLVQGYILASSFPAYRVRLHARSGTRCTGSAPRAGRLLAGARAGVVPNRLAYNLANRRTSDGVLHVQLDAHPAQRTGSSRAQGVQVLLGVQIQELSS
jgi:hypothetical protein